MSEEAKKQANTQLCRARLGDVGVGSDASSLDVLVQQTKTLHDSIRLSSNIYIRWGALRILDGNLSTFGNYFFLSFRPPYFLPLKAASSIFA